MPAKYKRKKASYHPRPLRAFLITFPYAGYFSRIISATWLSGVVLHLIEGHDMPLSNPTLWIYSFVCANIAYICTDYIIGLGPISAYLASKEKAEVVWNIPFWLRWFKKKYAAELRVPAPIRDILAWCKQNTKWYEIVLSEDRASYLVILYDGNDFMRLKLTYAEHFEEVYFE